MLLDLVIDHLAFILRSDASQEFLLRLGDAQTIKGLFDVRWDVIPVACLSLRGPDVVIDVIQIQPTEITTPCGRGTPQIVLERLEPAFAHPVGLTLHIGDLLDDFARQPLF